MRRREAQRFNDVHRNREGVDEGNVGVTRREVFGATWPFPWWAVALPAVIVGAATFGLVSQAFDWYYISRPVLSGMPRESVGLTGPIACAAGAWLGSTFVSRYSTVMPSSSIRAGGSVVWRALVSMTGWVCLAHIIGSAVPVLVLLRRSTAGHFYPSEAALGVPIIALFAIVGFLLGVVISRWWAIPSALAASGLLIYVFPMVFGATLGVYRPYSGSEILFASTPAFDHTTFVAGMWWATIAWWYSVAVVLGCLCIGLVRFLAGRGAGFAWLAGGAVAVISAAGLVLATSARPMFAPDEPSLPVCLDASNGRQVCVSTEEEPLLNLIVERLETPIDRIGDWPSRFTLLGTRRGLLSVEKYKGMIGSEITISAGVDGPGPVERDVAAFLSGLARCDDGADRTFDSINWSYELALWVSASAEADFISTDIFRNSFQQATTAEINAWYQENIDALVECRYLGEGP